MARNWSACYPAGLQTPQESRSWEIRSQVISPRPPEQGRALSKAIIQYFAKCPGLAPAQTHFLSLPKGQGALREADVGAAGLAVIPIPSSRDVQEEAGSADAFPVRLSLCTLGTRAASSTSLRYIV